MGADKFAEGFYGVWSIIRSIWKNIFSITYFGAPFTIGDLLITILFVTFGVRMLLYFGNHSGGNSGGSGDSQSYD